MKKFDTRAMTTTALLVAMTVFLARFCSISAWNIRIGFSFLPVAVAAILFGMKGSCAVASLSDIIGTILFPVGPYFPGFTLTAFLTGIVYAIFLHKKQTSLRILGCVAVNQLFLSLFLNSFWISIWYSSPYLPLLATRSVQTFVVGIAQFLTLGVVSKILSVHKKQVIG